MRIWDLDVNLLCRNHLLGEHRELHVMWNVITQNKKGYSNHPETKRWVKKLKALWLRHEQQVDELKRRGYNHASPLDESLATGSSIQDEFVNTEQEQIDWIKTKGCECKFD